MALITYAQAVAHLKQNGVLDVGAGSPPEEDADLLLKVEQASAIVVWRMERPGEWDVDTDPESDPDFARAQSLVLQVLAWLYRYRGDDEKTPGLETILGLDGTLGMLKDRVIA
jgi:hypothetical protein